MRNVMMHIAEATPKHKRQVVADSIGYLCILAVLVVMYLVFID